MVGRAVDTIVTSRAARKTQAQSEDMTVAICSRLILVVDSGVSGSLELICGSL